jgi:hypothetical protein
LPTSETALASESECRSASAAADQPSPARLRLDLGDLHPRRHRQFLQLIITTLEISNKLDLNFGAPAQRAVRTAVDGTEDTADEKSLRELMVEE